MDTEEKQFLLYISASRFFCNGDFALSGHVLSDDPFPLKMCVVIGSNPARFQ